MRDLDRIREVREYRVTGPQLGSIAALIALLVGAAGLVGYQVGVIRSPIDEELLAPRADGGPPSGGEVLADLLAEREQGTSRDVPARSEAPDLAASLAEPETAGASAHGQGLTADELLTLPDDDAEDAVAGADEVVAVVEVVTPSPPPAASPAPTPAPAPAPSPTPMATPSPTPTPTVTPSPAPTSTPSLRDLPEAPTGAHGYTVQLAAYDTPDKARELIASLRARGIEAFHQQAEVQGQTWYRVRVGIHATREQADEAARTLVGVSPFEPFVARQP